MRKQGRLPVAPQKAKGRPIPGYTLNRDGTIILDVTLIQLLKQYRELPEFHNGGGYHKLVHYLRRDHHIFVNKKKIYRLCKENGLLLPRNKKKSRQNYRRCINRKITAPNQLWEFDIKYGYIQGENRFFYLLAFIDVFSRDVVEYYVGLSCKAANLKTTFEMALKKRKLTEDNAPIIRSDNGPQMTSYMFKNYVDSLGLEHEFIPPRTPNKNAHVESFFSIVESEFLQVKIFKDFEEVYKETMKWIEFYRTKRIHGSLKMMSPSDFIGLYSLGKVELEVVSI